MEILNKLNRVRNIYYADKNVRIEHEDLFGSSATGLILELEDGRLLRAQSTDVIMSFEELPDPQPDEKGEDD